MDDEIVRKEGEDLTISYKSYAKLKFLYVDIFEQSVRITNFIKLSFDVNYGSIN